MKILFTGASSFTGMWFARALAAAGHELTMVFRGAPNQYEGVRRQRVEATAQLGRPAFNCAFGDTRFMQLIEEQPAWDMLCHHAADASNYKSPDFDPIAAAHNNTLNLRQVLATLARRSCGKVLLTGSVFEPGEGAGSEGVPAFSPYGLSKGLTAQAFVYYTQAMGMHLGKFVIPNPFGPYEEPRFTSYLIRAWHEGKTPIVNTPAYVRDNIHVSLLARAYADYATSLPGALGITKLNPSGYVETQGCFAFRCAREMRDRLRLPCELELKRQTEFSEPRIRINTDPLDAARLGWDEGQAWDEMGAYYESILPNGVLT